MKKKVDVSVDSHRFIGTIHRRSKKIVGKIKSTSIKGMSITMGDFNAKAMEID